MDLYLATNNQHKVTELQKVFGDQYSLKSIPNYVSPAETGKTLRDNSEIKARAGYKQLKLPNSYVLADDSGFFTDGIPDYPGVHSREEMAKFPNLAAFLENLKRKTENRKASMRTMLSLYDGKNLVRTHGQNNGRISEEVLGPTDFGYDAIFIPEGYDMTYAQLKTELKSRISHRTLAVRQLLQHLEKIKRP